MSRTRLYSWGPPGHPTRSSHLPLYLQGHWVQNRPTPWWTLCSYQDKPVGLPSTSAPVQRKNIWVYFLINIFSQWRTLLSLINLSLLKVSVEFFNYCLTWKLLSLIPGFLARVLTTTCVFSSSLLFPFTIYKYLPGLYLRKSLLTMMTLLNFFFFFNFNS